VILTTPSSDRTFGLTSKDEIGPGHKMVEYAYIVDFASVLFIYLSVRNMGEVGGKSANVLSES
jgi:hypothetical protein